MRLFIRTDLHNKILPLNEDINQYKESPTSHLNLQGQGNFTQTGFLSVFEIMPQNDECLLKKLQDYAGRGNEKRLGDKDKVRIPAAIKYVLDYYTYLGKSQAKYFHIISLDTTDKANIEDISLSGKVTKEDEHISFVPYGMNILPAYNKNKAQIFNTRDVIPLFAPGEYKEIAEILLGGGWTKFASVITMDEKKLAGLLLNNRREFIQSPIPDAEKTWQFLQKDQVAYRVGQDSSATIISSLKRTRPEYESHTNKKAKINEFERFSVLEAIITKARGRIPEADYHALSSQVTRVKTFLSDSVKAMQEIIDLTQVLHDKIYEQLGAAHTTLCVALASEDDSFKLFSGRLDAIEIDIDQFHTDKELKNDVTTIDDIWLKLDQLSAEIKKTGIANNTQELPEDHSPYKPKLKFGK